MGIDRELMRGAGPVTVLNLLSQREMYGYELVQEVSTVSQGILNMGQSTLYPMLYGLEAKKLVRSKWRDASNGRRRKYYSLTAKGRKQLGQDLAKWQDLVEALRSLGIVDTGGLDSGLGETP